MTVSTMADMWPTDPAEPPANWTLDSTDALPAVMPPPGDPMAVARILLSTAIEHVDKVPTWAWWRGDFYRHTGTDWAIMPESVVEQWAYRCTENAEYEDTDAKGKPIACRWAPTTVKVRNLIHALGRGVIQRDPELESEDAAEFVACRNVVVKIGDLTTAAHTPARFNLFSLPFDYDPDAACPQWLAFLAQILPEADEQDAVMFLQEWFGYVISGRTDLHKIASLIGDKRCGKGTIARVLIAMVGQKFVSGPKLQSLAGTFGMEPLIGKRLAVMGDVRWSAKNASDAIEVLLGVSGGDTGTVHRKNRTAWEGTLSTRFMLMSNDEPRFNDASGAMASRMIHVAFRQSFYGREDHGLSDRLISELPGILNWALQGLARLNGQGHFTVPASSKVVDENVQRVASPTIAFIADKCIRELGAEESLTALFEAWQEWCRKTGRSDGHHTEDMLSSQLRSALRSGEPPVSSCRRMRGGVRTTWFSNFRLRTALDRDDEDEAGGDKPSEDRGRWLIGGGSS